MSLASHLVVLALLLRGVRTITVDPAANPPGTVELLMVEQQGSRQPTAAAQPTNPAPPAPPAPPQSPPPPLAESAPTQPNQAALIPLPSDPNAKADPTPPPPTTDTARPSEAAKVKSSPPPAPRPDAPVFNLEGTDSESNAIVAGDHVIPASPDDRFRNRPPIYPYDAAARHEHGTVVLIIHVSEFGVSTGIDVAVTSGVASLDRAALDAVRKWHFRPAMRDGRTVPFEMPMRFIFDAE